MASIQYVVNATDAASSVFAKIALSADGLDKQLEDLGKRVAEPEVDLKDAAFTAGMIRAAQRIDKLSAMMATPGANLEDGKFQAEIIKINAQLDRLDKRHVTATVSVETDRSFLSRIRGLFGGGGAAGGISAAGATAGAGGQGFGGLLGALGPIGQGAAIGGGILGLATLLPALLPAALGGLVGGGAAGGALLLGSAANKQLVALQKSLATAKGPQRGAIQSQIKALQQSSGPELSIFGAFQNVGTSLKDAFAGALKAPGPGFSGGAGAPSFLTGLTGILKQLAGFAKTLQPLLGDLFRASIPYLSMFVKFLEQAAKILLPVFTQMLQQMIPYLPLFAKGLLEIVKGFAGFLQAIGPQAMQASAKIFVTLAIGMEYALKGLGIAINWLAKNVPVWVHDIATVFDWLRRRLATNLDEIRRGFADFGHTVAADFDQWRHDWAHTWDVLFQALIGREIRGAHDIEAEFNTWRHNTAVIFDGARHDIAAAWDWIWNNTVARVQRGIGDVVSFFKGLPGRALNALFGFGHSLYAFGHAALDDFLSGLKSIGGTVLGWLKNFIGGIPSAIMHFLHMSPPHAGSVFYDLGANLMRHLGAGIKSGAHHALGAAKGALGAVSGALGGDALANQALARRIFPWGADQWQSFVNLVMAESGFNRFATNPTSGAYGIAQALPPSKMPFAAQRAGGSHAGAQLSWMFDYIRSTYGTPAGAWGHEVSAGWYDRGGWLPPGLSLALNTTGAPERVGGGGITVNVSVSPLSSPAETGRKVAEVLAEFKKRGGMVYAPGGF